MARSSKGRSLHGGGAPDVHPGLRGILLSVETLILNVCDASARCSFPCSWSVAQLGPWLTQPGRWMFRPRFLFLRESGSGRRRFHHAARSSRPSYSIAQAVGEGALPLIVTMDPAAGVEFASPVYPLGEDRTFQSGPGNVYMGTVVVSVPVTVQEVPATGRW